MLMMSPSFNTFDALGMPWQMTLLTEVQMTFGNPLYPRLAGTAFCTLTMYSWQSRSSSSVLMPGFTCSPIMSSTSAANRPASRMQAMSAADFRVNLLLREGVSIP